jgi:hypothetical protein
MTHAWPRYVRRSPVDAEQPPQYAFSVSLKSRLANSMARWTSRSISMDLIVRLSQSQARKCPLPYKDVL